MRPECRNPRGHGAARLCPPYGPNRFARMSRRKSSRSHLDQRDLRHRAAIRRRTVSPRAGRLGAAGAAATAAALAARPNRRDLLRLRRDRTVEILEAELVAFG